VRIWTSQSALLGTGIEHQPVAGVVCHVESVDGSQAKIEGIAGMNAPATRANAPKQALSGQKNEKLAAN
jgi:hypothetical protein